MRTVRFRLSINADDYLRYYQGIARNISVIADDGRRIEFPAEHLRAFVMRDGVHGLFELVFDQDNKFVALRKI
ncbi:MAG: DUF2835 family protein [Gammaproteobacteria bacterium]|nr:DUF2835 family protein [Gammaproteobacteria bacterium]